MAATNGTTAQKKKVIYLCYNHHGYNEDGEWKFLSGGVCPLDYVNRQKMQGERTGTKCPKCVEEEHKKIEIGRRARLEPGLQHRI